MSLSRRLMDPGRAQAGSWATRIGLVATKVPFELGLRVAQVCSGETITCELSVHVCVRLCIGKGVTAA